MANFEVEIKSLLGDAVAAAAMVAKMKEKDSEFVYRGRHKQLNHYFQKGDLAALRDKLKPYLAADKQKQLEEITQAAKDFSVRTRWADGLVLFVMKATVDDTSSSNGTARQEFETDVGMSFDELDQLLLSCGFEYQAKWSREREEYSYKGLNVTVDKNAGYGYLAEFEAIVEDQSKAPATKDFIRGKMAELGVKELPQDRLERMFAHYNSHWQEYYGTEKTFIID